MEKSDLPNKRSSTPMGLSPIEASAVARADAMAAAIPCSKRMKKGCNTSCVLSHLLLWVLRERHGVLLLVPLLYFSGMLLFMRNNGGDVYNSTESPSPPAPLHGFSIFSIFPKAPSLLPPSRPPPPHDLAGPYIFHAWELDILAEVLLQGMVNTTSLAFLSYAL